MKIFLIIQLISLVVLFPLPGYPTSKDTTKGRTSTNGNDNEDENTTTPRQRTGKASGTRFSQIALQYGERKNDSISTYFLQYPEPNPGWENEELCQSSATPSPINIPYESDLNIIKDGFNVEISSIDCNFLESGRVEFQQNHAWGLGINNGGSITVNIEKKESTFYLSEVYFHLYSEHRIENKQYPLEMQLVHYKENYQNNFERLIISVLFDYSNNIENKLLNELKVGLQEEIDTADFSEIVKKSKPFYYYKGGLTIPPCSENVHWIIFRDIHNMTYTQFDRIKNLIENTHYYKTGYGNARGIKSLYNRKIYYETKSKTSTKILSVENNVKETDTDSGQIPIYKFINLSNILMLTSLLFLL